MTRRFKIKATLTPGSTLGHLPLGSLAVYAAKGLLLTLKGKK